MGKKLEEQIVQKFPYRCPYCENPVSYDQIHLKEGENEVECPTCRRTYIKVVKEFTSKKRRSR